MTNKEYNERAKAIIKYLLESTINRLNISNQEWIKISYEAKPIIDFLLCQMKSGIITKEEYRNLQILLVFFRESYYNQYPICMSDLTEDKIMFIADTHYGNHNFENRKLINIAYNEALKQNIKTIIHAGDITEACCVDNNKRFEVALNELETAISDMPEELTTRALLGNHDYSAIRNHRNLIPYYFNSPKLDILGFEKVILNWYGMNLCLSHGIKQLTCEKIDESKIDITLEGHHHFYDYLSEFKTIRIPSLSSLATMVYLTKKENIDFCALCVIATIVDEHKFLFEIHSIDAMKKGIILPCEAIEFNTQTRKLTKYNL